MTAELEYKYEVKVEKRDKSMRLDAATREVLRDAGMINNNKLKISGVSPKMLKAMKMEFVQCPVIDDEVHFVPCFVCPNFQSRVSKMVLCRGDPLPESLTSKLGGKAKAAKAKRKKAKPGGAAGKPPAPGPERP